jgi:hypothetical protein
MTSHTTKLIHPHVSTQQNTVGQNHTSSSFFNAKMPRFGLTRSISAFLLLSASAIAVSIADLVLGSWGDDHLIAAFVLLVGVVAITLWLLSPMAWNLARKVSGAVRSIIVIAKKQQNERHFWNAAMADPRVMCELQTMASVQNTELQIHAPSSNSAVTIYMAKLWTKFLANQEQKRADAYTWACAKQDPRLMAELQMAMMRGRGNQ